MLSETLVEGLESYRIGSKVRALRSEKGIGLAQLGEHTGLSAGMLSKIERDQVFPTLPTLLRISLVFGVGLEHFFSDPVDPTFEIVRRADRLPMPDTTDGPPSYLFESLDYPVPDRALEGFLAEFKPRRGLSKLHTHEGAELLYVISGSLELHIHGNIQHLNEGDSVYFDSDHDHGYRCSSETPCRAVVVVSNTNKTG